ncbi:MAG: tetratricopeptide repeat protein [Polyangiaceae bacterium]
MIVPRATLCCAAVAVGLACSAPATALADPVSDAKDLFARGRDLRTKGDCAAAAPLFRKAYQLYPEGLSSERNLAECEEALGHFASARRAWLDLERALVTTRDRKYDGWHKDAEDAAARLAPKLATLTIDLNTVGPGGEAASSHGVQVTLDGEALAPALVGTPLERDPGRHEVQVTGARVKEAAARAVELAAGDAKRIALRVVVAPDRPADPEISSVPQPSPVPPGPPADDVDAQSRATKRTVSWIAIGVGGASLIGAGISLAVRQSALDGLHGCYTTPEGCDPSLRPTVSRGQAASTAVTVLGIVGVVGLTSGIVLLATSYGHAGANQARQARLVVTPTLGGASAAWRF